MDVVSIFRQLASFFISYLATVTVILSLIGTIGIANNGTIMIDERDERKYQEKKYN